MMNCLQKLLVGAINTVLPPRCLITGDIVDRQGMISSRAWADLDFISEPCCASCGFPFEFDVGPGALCGPCLEDRPEYESARAALKYNDASRGLILKFKHGDQTHAAPAFLPWLKVAGGDMLAEADMLLPVPLHPLRLLRRRYNQSALIARALGKEMSLAVKVDVLRRVRSTPSQGHKNVRDRKKNVKSAFDLVPGRKKEVKGKTIVLVDDVYTTGATVRECTRVLMKAGAAKVHVLCVARVIKGGS